MVFRGNFEHSLDAKHRLTVPSKYRDAFRKGVVLAKSPETRVGTPRSIGMWPTEAFERYTTAVDVVTTSEVTVSVTVDDRRHLEAIVEALSEFSQVTIDHEMALLCAVGDRLRNEPAIGLLEVISFDVCASAAFVVKPIWSC